ncbi:MAG: hypothetical protein LBM01_03405 [Christensenellaceae bacterium]|jgi:hypothetical protein|nr:hypothetical protein [Christensenellaceae bacterium]
MGKQKIKHALFVWVVGIIVLTAGVVLSGCKTIFDGINSLGTGGKPTPQVYYTITFNNVDGTQLETKQFLKGSVPQYTGATPTYSDPHTLFDGWTPSIIAAVNDATYTAKTRTTGHVFSERTTETCTRAGQRIKRCIYCGLEEVIESVPAAGHDWKENVNKVGISSDSVKNAGLTLTVQDGVSGYRRTLADGSIEFIPSDELAENDLILNSNGNKTYSCHDPKHDESVDGPKSYITDEVLSTPNMQLALFEILEEDTGLEILYPETKKVRINGKDIQAETGLTLIGGNKTTSSASQNSGISPSAETITGSVKEFKSSGLLLDQTQINYLREHKGNYSVIKDVSNDPNNIYAKLSFAIGAYRDLWDFVLEGDRRLVADFRYDLEVYYRPIEDDAIATYNKLRQQGKTHFANLKNEKSIPADEPMNVRIERVGNYVISVKYFLRTYDIGVMGVLGYSAEANPAQYWSDFYQKNKDHYNGLFNRIKAKLRLGATETVQIYRDESNNEKKINVVIDRNDDGEADNPRAASETFKYEPIKSTNDANDLTWARGRLSDRMRAYYDELSAAGYTNATSQIFFKDIKEKFIEYAVYTQDDISDKKEYKAGDYVIVDGQKVERSSFTMEGIRSIVKLLPNSSLDDRSPYDDGIDNASPIGANPNGSRTPTVAIIEFKPGVSIPDIKSSYKDYATLLGVNFNEGVMYHKTLLEYLDVEKTMQDMTKPSYAVIAYFEEYTIPFYNEKESEYDDGNPNSGDSWVHEYARAISYDYYVELCEDPDGGSIVIDSKEIILTPEKANTVDYELYLLNNYWDKYQEFIKNNKYGELNPAYDQPAVKNLFEKLNLSADDIKAADVLVHKHVWEAKGVYTKFPTETDNGIIKFYCKENHEHYRVFEVPSGTALVEILRKEIERYEKENLKNDNANNANEEEATVLDTFNFTADGAVKFKSETADGYEYDIVAYIIKEKDIEKVEVAAKRYQITYDIMDGRKDFQTIVLGRTYDNVEILEEGVPVLYKFFGVILVVSSPEPTEVEDTGTGTGTGTGTEPEPTDTSDDDNYIGEYNNDPTAGFSANQKRNYAVAGHILDALEIFNERPTEPNPNPPEETEVIDAPIDGEVRISSVIIDAEGEAIGDFAFADKEEMKFPVGNELSTFIIDLLTEETKASVKFTSDNYSYAVDAYSFTDEKKAEFMFQAIKFNLPYNAVILAQKVIKSGNTYYYILVITGLGNIDIEDMQDLAEVIAENITAAQTPDLIVSENSDNSSKALDTYIKYFIGAEPDATVSYSCADFAYIVAAHIFDDENTAKIAQNAIQDAIVENEDTRTVVDLRMVGETWVLLVLSGGWSEEAIENNAAIIQEYDDFNEYLEGIAPNLTSYLYVNYIEAGLDIEVLGTILKDALLSNNVAPKDKDDKEIESANILAAKLGTVGYEQIAILSPILNGATTISAKNVGVGAYEYSEIMNHNGVANVSEVSSKPEELGWVVSATYINKNKYSYTVYIYFTYEFSATYGLIEGFARDNWSDVANGKGAVDVNAIIASFQGNVLKDESKPDDYGIISGVMVGAIGDEKWKSEATALNNGEADIQNMVIENVMKNVLKKYNYFNPDQANDSMQINLQTDFVDRMWRTGYQVDYSKLGFYTRMYYDGMANLAKQEGFGEPTIVITNYSHRDHSSWDRRVEIIYSPYDSRYPEYKSTALVFYWLADQGVYTQNREVAGVDEDTPVLKVQNNTEIDVGDRNEDHKDWAMGSMGGDEDEASRNPVKPSINPDTYFIVGSVSAYAGVITYIEFPYNYVYEDLEVLASIEGNGAGGFEVEKVKSLELDGFSGEWAVFAPGTDIQKETILKEGSVFGEGFTFQAGETIPAGTIFTNGTTLPRGMTFTEGQVFKIGMTLPADTILFKEGTVLKKGYIVKAGITLPVGFVIPAGETYNVNGIAQTTEAETTLETSEVLYADWVINSEFTTNKDLKFASAKTLTEDWTLTAGASLILGGDLRLTQQTLPSRITFFKGRVLPAGSMFKAGEIIDDETLEEDLILTQDYIFEKDWVSTKEVMLGGWLTIANEFEIEEDFVIGSNMYINSDMTLINDYVLELGTQITGSIYATRGSIIKDNDYSFLTEGSVITQGSKLAEGTVIGGGSVLRGRIAIIYSDTKEDKDEDGNPDSVLKAGTILPKYSKILAGEILPAGTVIKAGETLYAGETDWVRWFMEGDRDSQGNLIILDEYGSLQNPRQANERIKSISKLSKGQEIPSGTAIRQYEVIPSGTILAAGQILPKNLYLSKGTNIPSGSSFYGEQILPAGSVLKSATFSAGTVFPVGTVLKAGNILKAGWELNDVILNSDLTLEEDIILIKALKLSALWTANADIILGADARMKDFFGNTETIETPCEIILGDFIKLERDLELVGAMTVGEDWQISKSFMLGAAMTLGGDWVFKNDLTFMRDLVLLKDFELGADMELSKDLTLGGTLIVKRMLTLYNWGETGSTGRQGFTFDDGDIIPAGTVIRAGETVTGRYVDDEGEFISDEMVFDKREEDFTLLHDFMITKNEATGQSGWIIIKDLTLGGDFIVNREDGLTVLSEILVGEGGVSLHSGFTLRTGSFLNNGTHLAGTTTIDGEDYTFDIDFAPGSLGGNNTGSVIFSIKDVCNNFGLSLFGDNKSVNYYSSPFMKLRLQLFEKAFDF